MMPATGVVEGEVLPPTLANGNEATKITRIKLASPFEIRQEMASVYRLARTGKIRIEEATRLCYMLDRISTAIRAEREIEALESAYAEAFTGLTVKLAAPRKPKGDCDVTN